MMEKYICSLLYEYDTNNSLFLLKEALNVLGFEAKYMSLSFGESEKSFGDIVYDRQLLFAHIKGKSQCRIMVKNQLYDSETRDSLCWFRFVFTTESPFGLNTSNLEWSNARLDFLWDQNIIDKFVKMSGLICCYCYNQYDSANQSDEQIENFIKNYPERPFHVVKNFMDKDVVDVSQHWGRYVSVRDMVFMAAPLMWFGEEYFKSVPKESLLNFEGAKYYKDSNIINIKLFELYNDPDKLQNREKQKLFWNTFELQKVAEKYEKDRPFNFIEWYKNKLNRKKK